ncbi:MAG TPA: RNA 3'-terminal phosphate cyclase [Spirochaetota bacterium]|nr:RNA 3'-terminal phosphate cyclase [Spirochaetota bacterium]HOS38465.1 RNA 3'-terminal phosphate cyclase [Spirochaetota bacterium]HPI22658.1 RNA 3'-terminal phosphate cyclase [Spirochaetota bacterium]HPU89601.1 RNA 3'-terminal phosphate cyclase [Spirochaetota bacterium]
MIVLNFDAPDWISVRLSIALSLAMRKPVTLPGAARVLDDTPHARALIGDIETFLSCAGCGSIAVEEDAIIFRPETIPGGRYRIASGPCASAVELLLAMAPALSMRDFQSRLTIRGVTHASQSHPTVFLNETLFQFTDALGFPFFSALVRYGFFGTGNGSLDAKIYPRTHTNDFSRFDEAVCSPTLALAGARITVSKLPGDIAREEKRILSEGFGTPDERVSIIEVMDAAGPGHSVNAYLHSAIGAIVVTDTFDFFDATGERIVDPARLGFDLQPFVDSVRAIIDTQRLPDFLLRELVPYCIIAGHTAPGMFENAPDAARDFAALQKLA